ncbi:hypothetical protein BDN70DRAFT_205041 [Pholiota conissans]|uniref:Uncharacterized protein n=1 Tax=Pholiota conissans TaxID=109636 RepID=A0A9P6CX38_9AGAR|nr:hypothetical protein BDN70DRAFT_205041 [Pholiota conissans]
MPVHSAHTLPSSPLHVTHEPPSVHIATQSRLMPITCRSPPLVPSPLAPFVIVLPSAASSTCRSQPMATTTKRLHCHPSPHGAPISSPVVGVACIPPPLNHESTLTIITSSERVPHTPVTSTVLSLPDIRSRIRSRPSRRPPPSLSKSPTPDPQRTKKSKNAIEWIIDIPDPQIHRLFVVCVRRQVRVHVRRLVSSRRPLSPLSRVHSFALCTYTCAADVQIQVVASLE